MSTESDKELDRQFRVLKQTLAMHTMLRDRYAIFALINDLTLLTCSVIFCATTFSSNDVFVFVGLSGQKVRIILGIASISAFLASLYSLRINWKGKSAQHKDAAKKMTTVLALFRQYHNEDGTWSDKHRDELIQAYWSVHEYTEAIPDKKFLSLKARYLRKVEVSKMSSSSPGCPIILLKMILFCRSIRNLLSNKDFGKKD